MSFSKRIPLQNNTLPSFVLSQKHLLLKVAWKLNWWKGLFIHIILISIRGGHEVFVCSLLLDSAAHLQMGRDQMKKKTNSNDQSVKLTRLASLSGGQAFWLFEGRIGWGSCKLPNNLSAQHCAVLDITMFQVYLDHTGVFWCWSFPWLSHILKKVLLCYDMNPAEYISLISKKQQLNILGLENLKSLKNVDISGSKLATCFSNGDR